MSAGTPPPSWTASTSLASAVSATRCDIGPKEHPGHAELGLPGQRRGARDADGGEPLRPERGDQLADLLLVEDAGHEDHRRTGVQEALAALDRVGEHLLPVPVPGLDEGVGARVQHEVAIRTEPVEGI